MGKRNNFGFTLIEVLVVVAVLAVLASAVLAVLDPFTQIQKAQDARVKSDLAQIQRGLETYYQDNGSYPPKCSGAYEIQSGGNCVVWGNPWAPYMNAVPKDPTGSHNYIYYSPAGGQSYYLYANLGRGTKDTQACSGGVCTAPPSSGINMNTACGVACNYGVSSPNVSP